MIDVAVVQRSEAGSAATQPAAVRAAGLTRWYGGLVALARVGARTLRKGR
jgi:hypothetical protein